MDSDPEADPQPSADENAPDLECAICFSQFDNVFRTPKMLGCNHTFCLECLARMNVKSAQPNSIQCPLCRGFTPLPNLGLPKLATDSTVLSYLPAAMQRVYSIRFSRNKGRLQVKRPNEGVPPLAAQTVSHTLDVGQPSSSGSSGASREQQGQAQGRGCLAGLRRLGRRPACRACIMATTVLLMVLLTIVVIFLLSSRP
ncbi:RING finger protein 225 [Clupea harengus]|uniref:RING finger protein 225 n=1 Tax=Clupea harengus TaxID=7950 RepID=A0A6P3W0C6_CLUHA|nr:RING finger protein 225 [Clupea harengus]